MPTAPEASCRSVVVLGSLNLDRIWRLPSLPAPGQTLLARATRTEFGGKGANQAVAAARQGAAVHLVGAVGDDQGGREYLSRLRMENVGTSAVRVCAGVATGSAQIYLDEAGENMIVVDAAANAMLGLADVTRELGRLLSGAGALLLQLETPLQAVLEALVLADRHCVPAMLNASPVTTEFPWGSVPVDTVIVNEHECIDYFGVTPAGLAVEPGGIRDQRLARWRIGRLLVTRGSEPTLLVSAGSIRPVPVHPVRPVDTVGAGDTFAGALAAARLAGLAWEAAVGRANVAAALSTLRCGAQAAMPSSSEVDAVMATRKDLLSP